jgi:hypothetical protein
VDSITTFTKLIDKGRSGPTLDVIKEHIVWLRGLRDYRDYLVHRLFISTTSGGQVESENGVSVTTPYPVVVPATTPKHFPDTRRARHLDEPKTRFMTLTSEMTFTDIDGNKRLMERKIEIEPAPGYIRIEHLMARELTAFEAFLCAVVDTLVKLDFQPAPIACRASFLAPARACADGSLSASLTSASIEPTISGLHQIAKDRRRRDHVAPMVLRPPAAAGISA